MSICPIPAEADRHGLQAAVLRQDSGPLGPMSGKLRIFPRTRSMLLSDDSWTMALIFRSS